MLKPLHRIYAYIQLMRKYKELLRCHDSLKRENEYLRNLRTGDHETYLYSLERMHLKRQPMQLRHIQSKVSDYFRLMDSECYPLYAPLRNYLQKIGAHGDSSNIWTLPNGARVWIDPRMSSELHFHMKLLPVLMKPQLMDGWTTSVWSKEHKKTHISPQAVQEVVQALKHYMSVQGY